MKYYCYIIKFPNGKAYVGYTSLTPEERFKSHWSQRKSGKYPLHRALCKYERDDLIMETLDEFDDKDEALKAEQYYIEKFDTYAPRGKGYNATLGGEAPTFTWIETKTEEELAKINKRKANFGEKNGFFGKRHSEESKQKAVETRRRNGSYKKHPNKKSSTPRIKKSSIPRIKKGLEFTVQRMLTNNPMKNPEIAKRASTKRMETITSFEYWLDHYFYPKLGESAETVKQYIMDNLDTIKSKEIQTTFDIKRDFADSMIKRFKAYASSN
jgi:group I intron endonuclease